ncbi:Transcriptional regulator of ribosomal biogenesis proteins [Geranomyces michiganensis]|nr:Transcriptional regulator of ribosomal biogenesis proteins [Geranomyces michiganensis]
MKDEHKRRYQPSSSREAALLIAGGGGGGGGGLHPAPMSHLSYLHLAAPAASPAVAERSESIYSHSQQHISLSPRGIPYPPRNRQTERFADAGSIYRVDNAAAGNIRYEDGLYNDSHARHYVEEPSDDGCVQHYHQLEPQSRSETYPPGNRFLGPPVQQQHFQQQAGVRQSFSPIDPFAYDALSDSRDDFAPDSPDPTFKTQQQQQQRFSAPVSPLLKDHLAQALRPRVLSIPSRGETAAIAAQRLSPRSRQQEQPPFSGTISEDGMSFARIQHPQPQSQTLYNPFAASHQPPTQPTGFNPMTRRRSVSAPPMGIPLNHFASGASSYTDMRAGSNLDLLSPNGAAQTSVLGLPQSWYTGHQPTRRRFNTQLPPLSILQPSSGGTALSASAIISDSLSHSSTQMHPRVQHLMSMHEPPVWRMGGAPEHHDGYPISPLPRPASAPIMPPTPEMSTPPSPFAQSPPPPQSQNQLIATTKQQHTTIGVPQMYRQPDVYQSLQQQQQLGEGQQIMPFGESRQQEQQTQQDQHQSPRQRQPHRHSSPTSPNSRRTSRIYRCPKPFCTKTYKNPNGLKYHLDRGICEHFMTVNRNAMASPNPTRAFDTLEAAAAAGTVKIAHRPYWCKVLGCGKKYKNLNGLKYHAKAMHPALDFRAEVKGMHSHT